MVPNVALLGDAAHPLLPFTSQGVNLALEDACLLRDLLRDAIEWLMNNQVNAMAERVRHR